jgi:hypothetical protein
LVGLLAVPAGSPPPPPAVTAEPIASVQPPPNVTYCTVTGGPADPIEGEVAGPTARLIVYQDGGKIVEYNLQTKKKATILSGRNCSFVSARFVDDQTVVIAETSSIWVVDTVIGQVRELPILPNGSTVMGFAYSVAARQLAVLTFDSRSPALMTLTVGPPDWPQPAFSKSLRWSCSCDPLSLTYLQWSADGEFLVVGVPGDDGASLTVYRADGRRIGKTFTGELPQWIGDGRHLMIKRGDHLPGNFDEVTIEGRTVRHLFTTNHYFSMPSVSPDGWKIAFNNEDSTQTAVYDIKAKTLKMFGKMEMFPLWLNTYSVTVSKVVPCECDGSQSGYVPTGYASEITLRTGGRHPIGVRETNDADVWF